MSRPPPITPRTDFGEPPPGYIPGLGRGAVGFTTRSDIGPARPAAETQPPPGFPGRGRNLPLPQAQKVVQRGGLQPMSVLAANAAGASAPATSSSSAAPTEASEEKDYSEAQFDQFSGYQESLFAGLPYDEEDKEADEVFAAVDRHMDERRKRRREALIIQENEEIRKKQPTIGEQLRDLKRGLAVLTEADWLSIPEPQDLSRRNKLIPKNQPRFTPVPDTVLDAARKVTAGPSAVMDQHTQVFSGLDTPMAGTSGLATPVVSTDLTMLSKAKDTVLSMKLDRMADSVSGQTVVDPKGYLTDLKSIKVNSEAEVSEIQKATTLINSIINTNPANAPGWIALARLEAETGKLTKARQTIAKGCKACPTNEDVWLEAARLHPPDDARTLLLSAVKRIPSSVKLWLAARDLEQDPEKRKAVLRRALDFIPNSVKLWKAAVEQESVEEARAMLARAVQFVPQSVEMWLALARLETYQNAQRVLNQAREANPTDPTIWIAAAKLEEANGKPESAINFLINSAITTMNLQKVVISREKWLEEAVLAEKAGSILTCRAIVRQTVGLGIEDQDRRPTWLNDAKQFLDEGSPEVARAIYAHTLETFPSKDNIWLLAADLEKKHGTRESYDAVLKRAVGFCPQAEELWLLAAKSKWDQGDVDGARALLYEAFNANPNSQEIWLAAVKLESETDQHERARGLLAKARTQSGTARVYMKSALLERSLGNREAEFAMLQESLAKFPHYPKLYMMLGQFFLASKPPDVAQAVEVYKRGTKACPDSVDLWICYANLEMDVEKNFPRARAVLEAARLKIPHSPKLWIATARIEYKADKPKVAENIIARGLQDCPNSGLLWAYAIASDARADRKRRAHEALKHCKEDPHVCVAVAKMFWLEGKQNKARDWFKRAWTADPDLGDTWIWALKFELQHGNLETQERVIRKCAEAGPRHGELWTRITKNPNLKVTPQPADVVKQAALAIADDAVFPLV